MVYLRCFLVSIAPGSGGAGLSAWVVGAGGGLGGLALLVALAELVELGGDAGYGAVSLGVAGGGNAGLDRVLGPCACARGGGTGRARRRTGRGPGRGTRRGRGAGAAPTSTRHTRTPTRVPAGPLPGSRPTRPPAAHNPPPEPPEPAGPPWLSGSPTVSGVLAPPEVSELVGGMAPWSMRNWVAAPPQAAMRSPPRCLGVDCARPTR